MTDQPETKHDISGLAGVAANDMSKRMNYESDDASDSSDEELISKIKKTSKGDQNKDGPQNKVTSTGTGVPGATSVSVAATTGKISGNAGGFMPSSLSMENASSILKKNGSKESQGVVGKTLSGVGVSNSRGPSTEVGSSSTNSGGFKIKISRPNLSSSLSSSAAKLSGNVNATEASHSSSSKGIAQGSAAYSSVSASIAGNATLMKAQPSAATSSSTKNTSSPLSSSLMASSGSKGAAGGMVSTTLNKVSSSSSSLKVPTKTQLGGSSIGAKKKKKVSSSLLSLTTSTPTVTSVSSGTMKNISKSSTASGTTLNAPVPGSNVADATGSSAKGITPGGDGAKRKRKKTSKKLPSASDGAFPSKESASVGGGCVGNSLSPSKKPTGSAPVATSKTQPFITSATKSVSSGSSIARIDVPAAMVQQQEKKKKKKKQLLTKAGGVGSTSITSTLGSEITSKAEKKKSSSGASTTKHLSSNTSSPSSTIAAKMVATSTSSKLASHGGVSSKKMLSGSTTSSRKKTSKKKQQQLSASASTLLSVAGTAYAADASAIAEATDESDGGIPGGGGSGLVGGTPMAYYSSRDGGGTNSFRGQNNQHNMSSSALESASSNHHIASSSVSGAGGGSACAGYGYSAAQTAVNDMMRRALEENQYSAMGSIVDTESSDEDEGEAVSIPTNASRRLDQMEQWWCRAQFRNQFPEGVGSTMEGVDSNRHSSTDKKETALVSSYSTLPSSGLGITSTDTASGVAALVSSELVSSNVTPASSSLLGGEGEANVTAQQTYTKLDRGVMVRAMKKRLRLEALKHATIRTSAGSPVHVNVNAMIAQAAARHGEMQRKFLMEEQQLQREDIARNANVAPLRHSVSNHVHRWGQGNYSGHSDDRGTGATSQTIPVTGGSKGTSGGSFLYGRQVVQGNSSHHFSKLQQPFVVPSVASVLAHADLVNLYTPEQRLEQERSKQHASMVGQRGDEEGGTLTDCQEAEHHALTSNALSLTGVVSAHGGQVFASTTGKRKKRKGGRKKKTATPSGSLVLPGGGTASIPAWRFGEDGELFGAMSADEDDFYDQYHDENEISRNPRETSRLVKFHRLGISRTEVVTPDGLTVPLFPGVAGADGTVPVLSDDMIDIKGLSGELNIGNWWPSVVGGNSNASSSRSSTVSTRGTGIGGVSVGDFAFQFGSGSGMGSGLGGGGGINGGSSPNATWVKCDYCEKWRRLRGIVDSKKLNSSAKWDCSMNQSDPQRSKCTAPEEEYDAPSVVAGRSSSNPLSLAERATRKNLQLWLRRLHNNDAFEARLPPVTRSQKMKQKQQQQAHTGNEHQRGGAATIDASSGSTATNSNLHAVSRAELNDGSRRSSLNEFLYSNYYKRRKTTATANDKRKEEEVMNYTNSVFEQYAEPFEWIRCCNPTCGKWRSLLKGMDSKTILEKAKDGKWYCVLNTWDEKMASCSAPQENLPIISHPRWLVRDDEEEEICDLRGAESEDEGDEDTTTTADVMEEEESDEHNEEVEDGDDDDGGYAADNAHDETDYFISKRK